MARRIDEHRRANRITITRLGELIGLRTSTLQNRLAGRNRFTVADVVKCAAVFCVPICDLIPSHPDDT